MYLHKRRWRKEHDAESVTAAMMTSSELSADQPSANTNSLSTTATYYQPKVLSTPPSSVALGNHNNNNRHSINPYNAGMLATSDHATGTYAINQAPFVLQLPPAVRPEAMMQTMVDNIKFGGINSETVQQHQPKTPSDKLDLATMIRANGNGPVVKQGSAPIATTTTETKITQQALDNGDTLVGSQTKKKKKSSKPKGASSSITGSTSGGVQVQENDVVSGGRNVTVRNHAGNRRYIGLIRKFRQQYQTATKRIEKTNITKAVITIVENEFGGRFLKQNRSGHWVVLGEGAKHDKVSHALRIAVDPAFAIRKSRVGAEAEVDEMFPDGFSTTQSNGDSKEQEQLQDEVEDHDHKATPQVQSNEIDEDKASALALLQLSQTRPTTTTTIDLQSSVARDEQKSQLHPHQQPDAASSAAKPLPTLRPPQQQIVQADVAAISNSNSKQHDVNLVNMGDAGKGMPRPQDVTCGERNLLARKHPGNHKYNELIQKYRIIYQNAEKNSEKGRITKLVIDTVETEFGGRFVRQREDGEWLEIDPTSKHDKVSHALRTSVDPNHKPKTKKAKDKKRVASPSKESSPAQAELSQSGLPSQSGSIATHETPPFTQPTLPPMSQNVSQQPLMKWCVEELLAAHPPVPVDCNDLAVMIENSERDGGHCPASRRAILRFKEKRVQRLQRYEAMKREREDAPGEDSMEPLSKRPRSDGEDNASSPTPETQLRANDVTCGAPRGGSHNIPGNMRYQELIRNNRDAYQNAKKNKEKTAITNLVIQTVESGYGGRFVKQNVDGGWSEIDQNSKHDKVSHALRTSGEVKKSRVQKPKPVSLPTEGPCDPSPRYQ